MVGMMRKLGQKIVAALPELTNPALSDRVLGVSLFRLAP